MIPGRIPSIQASRAWRETAAGIGARVVRTGQRNRWMDDDVGPRPNSFDDTGVGFPLIVLTPGSWIVGVDMNDSGPRVGRCKAVGDDFLYRKGCARLALAAPGTVERRFDPVLALWSQLFSEAGSRKSCKGNLCSARRGYRQ